ncbi:GGDEF domain-containing protein [Sporomusa sp. KB1]|jgi:diguanylate cyclase (GGDEF)-like protein|uniref:GGDEF domain-containing protein n=1 Tax=Sporomusa sp. KB1 TaxID=943346 RepID=UPI0011AD811D|nr:GGDEF domain-containing protein [Sporomusa sp. KB1]TWH46281.1 diguanylate cyclase (GGDEF)-like protein [Sporomusa sp. KB1]
MKINTMLAIQMNIFMVILLLSVAVHARFRLNIKEEVHRLFLTLICLTIIILILEIFSVVLNSSDYIDFIATQKVVDTLGFALTPAVPIVATLYAYKRTNKYKKISISKFSWLVVPFIVNGILSFGSYHFNWIFSITDENLYVRGPLFFVSPMISFFYYIIHLLVLYDNRKNVNKEELIVISSLSLIPAMLSIFQLYYFIYLTIWNSVGIAVVINYISIMHEQAKRDPLTGLGNRMAYDEYLASWNRKGNNVLSVVNIDMDSFKSINDAFGHQEGDRVLKFFARQLEEVFEGIGVAIRLGGDEFIIMLNERSERRLEQYIKTLNDKIDAYNESSDMPYRIQFSCGRAIFDDSFDNVYEFIRHSDKLMYEDKQKKRR